MHKEEFIYKNQKTLFQIAQNYDFSFDDDNNKINKYDYVYRLVDISGNLISKVDKFSADGYGFGTVVKMSSEHIPQLEKNIKQMVKNCINDDSISENLRVNSNDNSKNIRFELEEDGIDLVVLVKVHQKDAYVIIFDSMPNYLNYYFLFANIHNFKNVDMSTMDEAVEKIQDKTNNFYFYYGNENTDSQFNDWLEETAPKIYKIFKKVEIIE